MEEKIKRGLSRPSLINVLDRIKTDDAFLGKTHSNMAIALYLLFLAFFPSHFYKMLGSESLSLVLVSILIIYGASRLPDLDNTRSSAISALGVVGSILSDLMRSMSTAIFHITKTKYDKSDSSGNPHRGFFHTALSAVGLFFLINFTTKIPGKVGSYTTGEVFVAFWVFICVQIALSSLFEKKYRKNKNKMGTVGILINTLISALCSFLVIVSTQGHDNQWLAFAISFGYLAHIFGDTLTVSGTPLLFPIRIKGKRWFNIRLARFQAGGDLEKIVVAPVFFIIAVLALIKVFV